MKGANGDKGLVQYAFQKLFEKQKDCRNKITISYFEVYNETIIDLLNHRKSDLAIRGSTKEGFYVENLTEKEAISADLAIEIFNNGEKQRSYASTGMNSNSSRSHVVLNIKIEGRYSNIFRPFVSHLVLVDLAGSEGIAHSNTHGSKSREGAMINKSLLTLSNVILKLNKSSKKHKRTKSDYISYRGSTLTKLFQPILSGNSKTLVICTVNPKKQHLQESLNTLQFGINAGGITTKTKPQKTQIETLSKEKIEEIDEISKKNEELAKLNLGMKEELEELKGEIDLKNTKIKHLIETVDTHISIIRGQEQIQIDLSKDNLELIETLSKFNDQNSNDYESRIQIEISKRIGSSLHELANLRAELNKIKNTKEEELFKRMIQSDEKKVKGLFNAYSRTNTFSKVKKIKAYDNFGFKSKKQKNKLKGRSKSQLKPTINPKLGALQAQNQNIELQNSLIFLKEKINKLQKENLQLRTENDKVKNIGNSSETISFLSKCKRPDLTESAKKAQKFKECFEEVSNKKSKRSFKLFQSDSKTALKRKVNMKNNTIKNLNKVIKGLDKENQNKNEQINLLMKMEEEHQDLNEYQQNLSMFEQIDTTIASRFKK